MHERWLTRFAVAGAGELITAALTVTPVTPAPVAALAGVGGQLPAAASADASVRVVVEGLSTSTRWASTAWSPAPRGWTGSARRTRPRPGGSRHWPAKPAVPRSYHTAVPDADRKPGS
jgi:hypothetical protein